MFGKKPAAADSKLGIAFLREDPVLDAKRFRVSEKGICLITQEMIDRLGN